MSRNRVGDHCFNVKVVLWMDEIKFHTNYKRKKNDLLILIIVCSLDVVFHYWKIWRLSNLSCICSCYPTSLWSQSWTVTVHVIQTRPYYLHTRALAKSHGSAAIMNNRPNRVSFLLLPPQDLLLSLDFVRSNNLFLISWGVSVLCAFNRKLKNIFMKENKKRIHTSGQEEVNEEHVIPFLIIHWY